MTESQPRVFLVRAGADGVDEEYALENGLAIIGFRDFGNLEGARSFEEVLSIVNAARPDLTPRPAGNYTGQLWAFAISMQEGDIVVLPRKLTSQVALGRVTGPYQYKMLGHEHRHTRHVKWIRPDVPRSIFRQDLLYSFGAALTVCNISRNNAQRRVMAILNGGEDPGPVLSKTMTGKPEPDAAGIESIEEISDLSQLARDQIVAHIQSHFAGHALAGLVDAVLRVDGWVTKVSPPGTDGGVDILAGRGTLGLDEPRLCVQVKSQASPADVTILRTLQGSMQTLSARQGLLVCWGGFTKASQSEARQSYFSVRLWESRDLVEAIYRTYEQLPAEIQAELPLKRVWMLVLEETEE
jgi:restriction system protein